jgi:hypothetical protein
LVGAPGAAGVRACVKLPAPPAAGASEIPGTALISCSRGATGGLGWPTLPSSTEASLSFKGAVQCCYASIGVVCAVIASGAACKRYQPSHLLTEAEGWPYSGDLHICPCYTQKRCKTWSYRTEYHELRMDCEGPEECSRFSNFCRNYPPLCVAVAQLAVRPTGTHTLTR